MPAFVFIGSAPAPYPWGMVNPGEVAFFAHRAPDGNWAEHVAAPAEAEPVAETESATDELRAVGDRAAEALDELKAAADGASEPLRQPNKAASADDWKAYAAADGSFQAMTGVHPDDATRKAIVDHYTAEEE